MPLIYKTVKSAQIFSLVFLFYKRVSLFSYSVQVYEEGLENETKLYPVDFIMVKHGLPFDVCYSKLPFSYFWPDFFKSFFSTRLESH